MSELPQKTGLSGEWRLVDTGPLDGPTNMAVDEALLLSFDPSVSLPVLRLYGWEPPALSLGRFQHTVEVLDLERCRSRGVPLVRRITGGGVIYHADELTYSVVCAPSHLPQAASIKESFRILTSFLLTFYRHLGLDPRYAADACTGARFGQRTPFCFAGKESYDIMIDGRKIGGNAQRRLRHVIFQHGSIPLRNRADEGAGYLRHRPDGISADTTSLADRGVTLPEKVLSTLLARSFREALTCELREDRLTAEEMGRVGELLRKYRDDGWNLAGENAGR